jgi:hypothetical protein
MSFRAETGQSQHAMLAALGSAFLFLLAKEMDSRGQVGGGPRWGETIAELERSR